MLQVPSLLPPAPAPPTPQARSLPGQQKEGPGLAPAADTGLFAMVLAAHYAKSVTDFIGSLGGNHGNRLGERRS